jgi:hypothetical protein
MANWSTLADLLMAMAGFASIFESRVARGFESQLLEHDAILMQLGRAGRWGGAFHRLEWSDNHRVPLTGVFCMGWYWGWRPPCRRRFRFAGVNTVGFVAAACWSPFPKEGVGGRGCRFPAGRQNRLICRGIDPCAMNVGCPQYVSDRSTKMDCGEQSWLTGYQRCPLPMRDMALRSSIVMLKARAVYCDVDFGNVVECS